MITLQDDRSSRVSDRRSSARVHDNGRDRGAGNRVMTFTGTVLSKIYVITFTGTTFCKVMLLARRMYQKFTVFDETSSSKRCFKILEEVIIS